MDFNKTLNELTAEKEKAYALYNQCIGAIRLCEKCMVEIKQNGIEDTTKDK